MIALSIGIGMLINTYIERNFISRAARKRKLKNYWILTVISALLVCVFVCALIFGTTSPIGNAERVANIVYDNGSYEPLYYDSESNEYFIVITNNYRPINISQRSVIDSETAEKYIDLYNQIIAIDIEKGHD